MTRVVGRRQVSMMAFSEVEGAPVEEGADQSWGGGLEDLQRTAAVGADQVEVEPVGGDFGPEVLRVREGFPIKELVLDEAVDRFDIALPGVALGWDRAVVATEGAHGGRQALLVLVLEELRAVVGLPDQLGEVDSVAGQMD